MMGKDVRRGMRVLRGFRAGSMEGRRIFWEGVKIRNGGGNLIMISWACYGRRELVSLWNSLLLGRW